MNDKIIHETDSLIPRLNHLERVLLAGGQKVDDTYSLNLLQPLLEGYPYLSFTGSSLRPFCLVHMLNDIIINERKSIIEFGSGISTILIGRLIRKNNLGARILSYEHDQSWIKILSELLKNEKLEGVVSVLYSPLVKCNLSPDNISWYDPEQVSKGIGNKKFDMVIIDGPPAWDKGMGMARYPAYPYVRDKLTGSYSIYLDDANRAGEQSVLRSWESEYAVKFVVTGGTLAYYYCGKSFYTEPFIYY